MAQYEKSWRFDINRAVTATTVTDMAKYTLWYYKAFLTGQIGGATQGLWTLVGSSDSVTGAMDGVDRWGPSFDPSKIVLGGTNSAHSWVVLRSPPIKGAPIYVLIAWDSWTNYRLSVRETATLPTAGSNAQNPTLTNAASSASTSDFCPSSNSGNFHMHGALATDGSFYMLQSRDNTGKFVSGFVGSWLGNAKPNDSYPFWFSFNCDSGMSTGYGYTTAYGLDYAPSSWMLSPDNSAQTTWNWAGVIPNTANLPVGSDRFDSSYLDFPVFIAVSSTNIASMRGRLQDISFFPGGAGSGTVDSTPGAPTYMVVGNYWFPTNAAPQL